MCTQPPAGRSHGGALQPNPLVAFWHFSHTWRLQVEPLSHWRRYYWTHREVWDTGLVAPALHNVTVKEKKKQHVQGTQGKSSGEEYGARLAATSWNDGAAAATPAVCCPRIDPAEIFYGARLEKNWNKTLKQNNSASISCTSPSRSLFVTVVAAAGAII